MKGCEDVGPWAGRPRAQTMMKSDEVEAMLHLHALGWGLKRIAREFGCSKNTVRRYVADDGWMAYGRRSGGGKLEDQAAWLEERFLRHPGNAEVVRQDLLRERSVDVSLRTVERAVAPFRRLLTAEAKATVRFETPPGRQLQIDFGQLRVPIADERVRVFLFVATLGYSRRCQVAAFRHERQSSWFRGLEGAFLHFGGVTKEGADRQPAAAGGRARRGHPRGRVPRAVPGVRRLLGLPSAGLRAVSGPDEGEGRARCWLREGERHRRTSLRELGGDGGAPGVVAAGDCGPAAPRHHRGSPAASLRPGSGVPAPLCGPAAVRPVAGSDPDGPCRLRRGGRHERLFGAVAADRRARAGGGQRRSGACSSRAGRRCGARRARGPARAGHRPRAPGRCQRRPAPGRVGSGHGRHRSIHVVKGPGILCGGLRESGQSSTSRS